MSAVQPSGTVTLVFTDVEGSTRLLEELGTDAYREALVEHRRVVREAFGAHRGYEVDHEGDAFFYAFASAQAAVSAVGEAMAGLAEGPIRIRVGIHTGEPALDPPKYVGMDVHRAARIMSAVHGGQVVLSPSTVSLLEPGSSELPAVAAALSVIEGKDSSPVDDLARALAGRRLLVLVDNVEHLMPDAADLVGAFVEACPSATTVVTTRERLQLPGEHVYAVPPMSETDGEALFRSAQRLSAWSWRRRRGCGPCARGWTTCRWRSSWRRRARSSSARRSSSTDSPSASTCSGQDVGWMRGRRHCARRSPGATTSLTPTSRHCFGG
jgi:class 3 adenylate cyclase